MPFKYLWSKASLYYSKVYYSYAQTVRLCRFNKTGLLCLLHTCTHTYILNECSKINSRQRQPNVNRGINEKISTCDYFSWRFIFRRIFRQVNPCDCVGLMTTDASILAQGIRHRLDKLSTGKYITNFHPWQPLRQGGLLPYDLLCIWHSCVISLSQYQTMSFFLPVSLRTCTVKPHRERKLLLSITKHRCQLHSIKLILFSKTTKWVT